MSVDANYIGNVNRPIHQLLASGSVTLIDTAIPNNSYVLGSWAFYNSTAGAVACTLYWFDGTTQRAIWGASIPAGSTVIVSDVPLNVRIGDEIRAQGASGVNVTLCYIQSFQTQNIQ